MIVSEESSKPKKAGETKSPGTKRIRLKTGRGMLSAQKLETFQNKGVGYDRKGVKRGDSAQVLTSLSENRKMGAKKTRDRV